MNHDIETHELLKRFGRNTVLDRVNLAVPEGSIYALAGPNGAGKTTTLEILVNVRRATSGHAVILGRDSRQLPPADFARIGYISENQELPEWMTVSYLTDYLEPFYPTWDREHARELLKQFELPADRKVRHLSRGMRMKTALASSLAYRPRMILLDEPFTGLDALVRDELISGVLEHAEGATILISSHDLNEIESFATHVGYLEGGRLRFSEEMESLAARFREIEILMPGPDSEPASLPPAWLNPDRSPSLVRFVDSSFEQERTMAEIRRVFGDGTQVQVAVKPMPLRSIFVTLAKAGRSAV